MGVYEGRGQLERAMKDLTNRWWDTKTSWRDAVAAQFEEQVLVSLARDLKDATGAMDAAAQMLAQIKNDCR